MARDKSFLDPVWIAPLITHMMFVNLKGDFANQESHSVSWNCWSTRLLKYVIRKRFLSQTLTETRDENLVEPTPHASYVAANHQHDQYIWYFFCAKLMVMLVLVTYIEREVRWSSHKTKWFFAVITSNYNFLDLQNYLLSCKHKRKNVNLCFKTKLPSLIENAMCVATVTTPSSDVTVYWRNPAVHFYITAGCILRTFNSG